MLESDQMLGKRSNAGKAIECWKAIKCWRWHRAGNRTTVTCIVSLEVAAKVWERGSAHSEAGVLVWQ